jgi:hypothetical protein
LGTQCGQGKKEKKEKIGQARALVTVEFRVERLPEQKAAMTHAGT